MKTSITGFFIILTSLFCSLSSNAEPRVQAGEPTDCISICDKELGGASYDLACLQRAAAGTLIRVYKCSGTDKAIGTNSSVCSPKSEAQEIRDATSGSDISKVKQMFAYWCGVNGFSGNWFR